MSDPRSITAWALLLGLQAMGQVAGGDTARTVPAPKRTELRIELSGLYDSNALRNDLVDALYQGETLGRDLRQRSQDDLKGENRAGQDLAMRIAYAWGDSALGMPGWRNVVSVAHHDVLGLRFTDDAYIITFQGNAQYEGGIAALGPSAQEHQRYQTFGFGVEDVARGRMVRLDVVNGQYLGALRLERGDLYTAVDGQFLEADLEGDWYASDTAGGSFGGSNGVGAAVSARWSFGSGKVRVTLDAEDLGLVAWNKASRQVRQDGPVRYDGLFVDNILDLDGIIVGEDQVLDTLGLAPGYGSYLRPLPARFTAALHTGMHRRSPDALDPALVTIDQLLVPGYVPRITVAKALPLSSHWKGVGSLSHGGFGGFRVGLGFAAVWPWGALQVDVPNVIGTLSPEAKGRALSLGLVAWFP